MTQSTTPQTEALDLVASIKRSLPNPFSSNTGDQFAFRGLLGQILHRRPTGLTIKLRHGADPNTAWPSLDGWVKQERIVVYPALRAILPEYSPSFDSRACAFAVTVIESHPGLMAVAKDERCAISFHRFGMTMVMTMAWPEALCSSLDVND